MLVHRHNLQAQLHLHTASEPAWLYCCRGSEHSEVICGLTTVGRHSFIILFKCYTADFAPLICMQLYFMVTIDCSIYLTEDSFLFCLMPVCTLGFISFHVIWKIYSDGFASCKHSSWIWNVRKWNGCEARLYVSGLYESSIYLFFLDREYAVWEYFLQRSYIDSKNDQNRIK